jgi:hypothetical protein
MGKAMLKNTEGVIRSVNGRKKDNTMVRIKKDDQITLHRKLKDRATGTPLKTIFVLGMREENRHHGNSLSFLKRNISNTMAGNTSRNQQYLTNL